MPASEDTFRKVPLERLSSPDQIDRLITLTSPVGWISVVALGILLASVVVWGFLGSVPTRVQGAGILVARGGQVFDAMASAAGTLSTEAAIGTAVKRGDLIATLDNARAEQELQHATNILNEQQEELQQLTERYDGEIAARRKVSEQQRENLQNMITAAEERRAFYADELDRDQRIAETGFITRRFMQDTRQQMEAAEQEVRRAHADLLRVDAEELDLGGRRDQDVVRQREAVNRARRTLDELKTRTELDTRVLSPVAGHVTEVKASAGSVVAPGKAILSIETAGEGLELVLYVPPDEGKKVLPGMEVRIEPATIKKEEFGTLVGRVINVSDFPVSAEGMTALLQNAQLVSRFFARGAPYAARVSLITDPTTPSGYKWSAGAGPPVALSSGTTAIGEVTVRRQAPIGLVLPLLRGTTGFGG
jgi:HlyD family secretion protein